MSRLIKMSFVTQTAVVQRQHIKNLCTAFIAPTILQTCRTSKAVNLYHLRWPHILHAQWHATNKVTRRAQETLRHQALY